MDGFVTELLALTEGYRKVLSSGLVLLSITRNNKRPVYPEPNLLLKYADNLTLSVPVSAHQDCSLIEVTVIAFNTRWLETA